MTPGAQRSAIFLIVALIALCTVVEAALTTSDWSLIRTPRLRLTVYEFAGFWPGLLGDWRPNYSAQPYTMFLTYGFLHGGPIHLLVNMFTLWSLGRAVVDMVGQRGFAVIYTVSLFGGAVGYAILAEGPNPMVGASGALFGLAGALLGWSYLARVSLRASLRPVLQVMAMLVAINIAMWWALSGQLAWQTHLGGFLAGFVIVMFAYPSAAMDAPD